MAHTARMPWFAILLCVGLAWMAPARAQGGDAPLPSFAELEAAGARIGEVRVLPGEIFDLANPDENNALFRAANRLHIVTHTGRPAPWWDPSATAVWICRSPARGPRRSRRAPSSSR